MAADESVRTIPGGIGAVMHRSAVILSCNDLIGTTIQRRAAIASGTDSRDGASWLRALQKTIRAVTYGVPPLCGPGPYHLYNLLESEAAHATHFGKLRTSILYGERNLQPYISLPLLLTAYAQCPKFSAAGGWMVCEGDKCEPRKLKAKL